MKNISIIAAHPDDEVLGCGGTILKHINDKDNINFLWLTDGIGARENTAKKDLDIRNNGLDKAIAFSKPNFYQTEKLPDNQLDSLPLLTLVQTIEKFILKTKPQIIYTHFINDLNIDHALTAKAVMTATRAGSSTFVPTIYSFEVASSTEWSLGTNQFIPDTYVDITEHIENKQKYLECYQTELRDYPHPRSIENILAKDQVRGAEVNLKFAEAFITMRNVISSDGDN